jgi:SAM-dependent methyltransferase
MSSPSSDPSGYFDHARREIFPLLPEDCESVLELGCSSGATLRELKKERKVLRSLGVEVSSEAAERASEVFDRVLVESLDSFDFDERLETGEEFDLDPWRVVRALSKRLSPRGVLIVSLPNIRHRSVIKDLVFRNEFNYADAGILDRTHLRFFVRKTAIELCECGGLVVTDCITNKKLKKSRRLFSILTRGWSDDFYNQQFNLAARRRA